MGETADERSNARAQPVIAALQEADLPKAQRIFRLAFGTFLGALDPETFWSDRDLLDSRFYAPHTAAFGASLDGQLAGSVFATKWGSVGFLGPITVHPDRHEAGLGRALIERTMAQFDDWHTEHIGLFTFAHSAKHVALYQKYGFYSRFLTAIMSRPIQLRTMPAGCRRFGELNASEQEEALRACRTLTDGLYSGLDLTSEIRVTYDQALGDTVLVEGAGGVAAFAVCHYGPKSEAGADNCFIKFGAARAGPSAARDYSRLLDACEALASVMGMPNLLAGANVAREEAYRHLVASGFRTQMQGIAMHKDNEPGYSRPGVYVIDDWR